MSKTIYKGYKAILFNIFLFLSVYVYFNVIDTPDIHKTVIIQKNENRIAEINSNTVIKLVQVEETVLAPTPTPTPEPTPMPIPPKIAPISPLPIVDKDYVKQRICEVFQDNCEEALTIAKYESGYRTNAISPTGDYGVMQINCYWQGHRIGMPKRTTGTRCNEFLDLEKNLETAKKIYSETGWSMWTTKIYLNQ